jgi:hypothetical protein
MPNTNGLGASASIDMGPTQQTPFVPTEVGTQALPQKLGSRIRGNERGMLLRETATP